ncbi:MAG: glucose-6-phosphate dehydrogenase [Terriglobia bacterium]
MGTQADIQVAATETPRTARCHPCAIVIFGASGDLAERKLLPALYDLAHQNHLPERFYILGVARRPLGTDGFREKMRAAVAAHSRFGSPDAHHWPEFARRLYYQPFDASQPGAYQRLRNQLATLDRENHTPGNYLFYLAVAPALYSDIVSELGAVGLARQGSRWSRIVVEKPFGHDRASARQLNTNLRRAFPEEQVYRIDHYLGKETVQNLAVFRFANGIFEPLWNRNYIDHVQISVAEADGVGSRAGYYDQAGALRDMIQNHLLQLLCLVAMEPPAAFAADAVRREKRKVLESIRLLSHREVERCAVRGQYGAGTVEGEQVVGYRQEKGVRADSPTETFAALRLEIDNWRWAGVPFYLRTGKHLAARRSEISVEFRDAPLQLFACTAMQPCPPNRFTLRIQPDECLSLRVITKTPGLEVIGRAVEMDFVYGAELKAEAPSAYETLLLDALEGDPMLFADAHWVEQAWELVDPVLAAWAREVPHNFPNYAAGSWGPAEADAFLARDLRHWHMQ